MLFPLTHPHHDHKLNLTSDKEIFLFFTAGHLNYCAFRCLINWQQAKTWILAVAFKQRIFSSSFWPILSLEWAVQKENETECFASVNEWYVPFCNLLKYNEMYTQLFVKTVTTISMLSNTSPKNNCSNLAEWHTYHRFAAIGEKFSGKP